MGDILKWGYFCHNSTSLAKKLKTRAFKKAWRFWETFGYGPLNLIFSQGLSTN